MHVFHDVISEISLPVRLNCIPRSMVSIGRNSLSQMKLFSNSPFRIASWTAAGILLSALLSCGTTVFAPKETFLSRPLGVSVTALDDREFRFSYFVSNEEEIFLGYNLYASKAPITDGDFQIIDQSRLVKLILPFGEEPTFAWTFSDANSVEAKNEDIRYFDGISLRFECGQRYYFRLRAMGEGKTYSRPSNEVSAVAQNDSGGC
jgi:hypothetical protein